MTFVDTWAWVALAVPEDQYHAQALATYRFLVQGREPMVTSDYVLGETITFLFGRIQAPLATRFVNGVLQRVSQGGLRMEPVTQDQFQRAWELRKRYQDKPDISFTDFTSMAIMEALQVIDIFSGDRHFSQVNMGFQLVSGTPME